jgi:hypothetical protein
MLRQVPLLDKGVRPNGAQHFLLGDHAAGVHNQASQHVEGLGSERHRLPVAIKTTGAYAELEFPKAVRVLSSQ